MVDSLLRRAVEKYRKEGTRSLMRGGLLEVYSQFVEVPSRQGLERHVLRQGDLPGYCREHGTCFELDQDNLHIEFPENKGVFDPVFPKRSAVYDFSAGWVCELPDVQLFGPRGVVEPDEDTFIYLMNDLDHFQGTIQKDPHVFHRRAIQRRTSIADSLFDETSHFDVAASFVMHHDSHYGHWLVEYLPRLRAISAYEQQTGREVTLIVNSDFPQWMQESLELLGYSMDRIVRWNNGIGTIDRFVLGPSNTVGKTLAETVLSPIDLRWLRDRLLQSVESTAGTERRRFYISRQGLEDRYVSNFAEIRPVLEDFDFEIVRPETHSFPDQIRMLSQADAIVGPRGSGLHNVIFARDACVVELTTPKWRLPIQQLLSNALGHQYTHVDGRAYQTWPTEPREYRKSAFEVDPELLRTTFERVLSDRQT